jgi:hypothetical protein
MAKKGSLQLIPEKKVMKAMGEMFARNCEVARYLR